MLGSLLVDIGLGLEEKHVSTGHIESVWGMELTNVVAGLVHLVTNSILGSAGTGAEGRIAILGDV